VHREDLVLDLGAGTGRLTAELARAARKVVAVELDPRMAGRLRGRWPNVEVVEGDAAAVPLPREPFRVVANLPFDRTTAILRHLLDDPRVPLLRADLIVEWSVAVKRALPWPSTVNGVLWGAWYACTLERRIPRTFFEPAPAVDAGLLVFERREQLLVREWEAGAYRRFVAAGFRRGLRAVVPGRALRRHRLARSAPRELDAHDWAALYVSSIRE
jgi:23S rRNA (adenine-N6)-dimethyltransferase